MFLLAMFLVTSSFLMSNEGAFTWLHSDSTVYFTQGEAAKLSWMVDVGTGNTWDLVKISRNNIKSDFEEKDLIRIIAPATRKVYLTKREADLDLDIKSALNIVNVTFVLRNLTRDTDEKYYKILVQNSDRELDNKFTKVNVYVPPEITTPDHNVTVNESSTAQLVCNANGNPTPNITWTKNGVIVGTGSPYTTPVVKRYNNSQCYTCQASNGIGQGKSAKVCLNVQYSPIIKTTNYNVTVNESSTAQLVCNANGNPTPTITWTKNGVIFGTESPYTTPVVTRYNNSQCYTCQASNVIGQDKSVKVCLNVQYSPVIKTRNYDVTVNESSTAQLVCNANGNPTPTITWTKNGVIVGTGSPYTTPVVTRYNNSQCYTCQASNGIGIEKSTRVCLNVQYKSSYVKILPSKEKSVKEGDRITLICSADGNPKPTYTWTHNGIFIPSSSKGMVVISSVDKRDNGTYTCIATNLLGRLRNTTEIEVNSREQSPVIYNPYKDFMVVDKGKDVSFACNATGLPVPNITWTKNGVTIGTGNTFNITRAKKDDSACYTCKATNGIGRDKNVSICLTVQYPPSDVRIVPSSSRITLREGDSLKLSCHGDSIPAPTFTWKHNGKSLSAGRNGTLLYETVYTRHSGSYVCIAENRLGSVKSSTIQIDVQYLDKPKVFGSNNKSYCQSNPEVWFNLSINTYPDDPPMSCKPSTSDLSTITNNLDSSGINVKQYLVLVVVKNNVDNASISCKARNGAVERQTTLYVYRQPAVFKEKRLGQFDIMNIEWQDEFKDSQSTAYKNLKNRCMKILQAAYKDVSYVVSMKVKTFLKGSVILQFQLDIIDGVSDPLIPLKTLIKDNGGNINGLAIAYESVQESKGIKEEAIPNDNNKTLNAVLVALFAVSLVLNMSFIAFFFWMRRKESNDKLTNRQNSNDETGNVNDIALQETSFNSTDNVTANIVPEYQPVGRRGLAASSAGIPEYEAVSTRRKPPTQQPSAVQSTSYSMTENEIVDKEREKNRQGAKPDRTGQSQGLPKQLTTNAPDAPSMYQTIQSQSGTYSSLSPLTKLPAKNTKPSLPNTNGEYQTIQKKEVPPQYQSLNDLSRC